MPQRSISFFKFCKGGKEYKVSKNHPCHMSSLAGLHAFFQDDPAGSRIIYFSKEILINQ